MVFVLDRHQKPLMPCSEKRARQLLDSGRARIHRMAPLTIRLTDRTAAASVFQDLRLKLDPGSQTTGAVLILDGQTGAKGIFFGEIVHKPNIQRRLQARRNLRRGRRFANRRRPSGWLPPSLEARVDQTLRVVAKIARLAPITALSAEQGAFDTQKLQNPEITGVEHQQGTLLGYEVREYLLMKWHHQCAYCDATDVPLEIAHVHPKSRGGSDRVSNLAMACHPCDSSKDALPIEVFLTQNKARRRRAACHAKAIAQNDPKKLSERAQWEANRLARIQSQLKALLQDAAVMNATRWRLYTQLKAAGLPAEGGSGGRIQMPRIAHGLPKEHYYDALCVGASTPERFTRFPKYVQVWSAKGRGNRQICRTNKRGFPIRYVSRIKQRFGFQTGDLVRAHKPQDVNAGVWTGRLTARPDGRFVVIAASGLKIEASWQAYRLLQRGDGWQYAQKLCAI